ncbi:MAG: ABC transporter permease subunit [Ruminiclostridium sp.]|nr:ABC transporter permease subunit [Ruminiclostridium sp.]
MRKKNVKVDVIIIIVLVLIAAAITVVLATQDNSGTASDAGRHEYMSVDEVADRNIGVMLGSVYEKIVSKNMPDANISFFDKASDMALAVTSGKIDAFACSQVQAEKIVESDSGLKILLGSPGIIDVAFAFPKTDSGAKLRDEFNGYLADITADGTLDKFKEKWLSGKEVNDIENRTLSGENGTLKMATTGTTEPYTFIENDKNVGLDIELAYGFCRKYGYGLDISVMDFSAMIPAISSSTYDFAGANITVTEERAESVYFSDRYTQNKVAVVVAGSDTSAPDISDYNGKRIGIVTGSSFEQPTLVNFPDSTYFYYDSLSDLILALQQNNIDGFVQDEPVLKMVCSEHPGIGYFADCLRTDTYSFGFQKTGAKSEKLQKQFNEMLDELDKNGTLDEMKKKWFSSEISGLTIDRSGITGENGTISVAVNTSNVPFALISNGEINGYAVELVTMFCRRYGYDCKYDQVSTASGLAGLASGVYDIYANNTAVTPERAESIAFSEPIYEGGITLAVRASELRQGGTAETPALTFDKLNSPDRTIGAGTGSAGMYAAEKAFPNANILNFNSHITGYEAVRLGKIDAYVHERLQMQIAIDNGLDGVILLPETIGDKTDIAVGLSRNASIPDLKNKIDTFLDQLREDGTLDDMFERWENDKNYTMPEIAGNGSSGLTLRIGTTGTVEPYSFYVGNDVTGFDIELAKRFASWLGADLDIGIYDFDGIVAAAQAGTIDCVFSDLQVTEERREVIDFSDPIYVIESAAMVADAKFQQKEAVSQSWFDGIVSSFEKNFIREERWRLILEGIGTTCIITVMSTLFGTILAFLICMFRRTGSALANSISNIYVKLLQGTPMVVLLMILYYVIFGKSGLDAVWVAIIGFSLNVGAYISEIMRSGIESIDGGQREAALALGYSENQAFFRFVFPQAAVRFLPVYKQEIVSLLKSTSIVGYIAIQDLTKMSDIIRSRTYEAFFPLIATAIIYFILAWIISMILKLVLKAVSPKRKRGAAK